jgi:hypothetical protein
MDMFAATLKEFDESEKKAVGALWWHFRALGPTVFRECVAEARALVAAGGLPRKDGTPRTKGGVLFQVLTRRNPPAWRLKWAARKGEVSPKTDAAATV